MEFLCLLSALTIGKNSHWAFYIKGEIMELKKILTLSFVFLWTAMLSAQVPVHLELNPDTGVYGKGEVVEVYASLTEF